MKKLIKPRSRERMRSLTLTPTRSESSEGFLGLPLDSQDSSSMGSGSNSLDDTLTHKRSSTLKRLPFMRNRSKDKDKEKAIYRRSMSMNDLLQTMALSGGQWAGSSENLDGPTEADCGSGSRLMKDLGSMAYSTNAINYAALTLPSGTRIKRNLKVNDNASCEDVPAFSDDPIGVRGQASRPSSLHSIKTISSNSNNNSHSSPADAKGALNGNLSRPHSESSGEFSLGLDQDVWSSGSSPVQQPLTRSSHQSPMLLRRSLDPQANQARKKTGSSSGSVTEVVSLQQFLEESIGTAESGSQENLTVESPRLSGTEHVQRDQADRGSTSSASTKGRGILRSVSGKAAPVNSDGRPPRGGQPGRPSLRKTESTRVKGTNQPRVSLSSQSKAMSVSERLDKASTSSSALPRASSVISTAEGFTRRTSIHDLLSKDGRQPVSVDPSPSLKASPQSSTTPSEYPPTKNPSHHPDHQSTPPLHVPLSLPKSVSMPCTGGRHPLITEETERSSLESFFSSSFTVESVFMDSIFSEPAFTGPGGKSHAILSLNTSLVSNISGPPGRTHPRANPVQTTQNQSNRQINSLPDQEVIDTNHGVDTDQSTTLSPEDKQSLWYEYGCV